MISQRLRGVSAEGDALEADFVPKLKKAFGDVSISIEDQNGELKSTYDILDELAAKWDTLSSKQRQFLGEKAAGNRQVKTLNAIMQNWDVVQDTIQKASEAEGAATEGNELYMNSIQGRITQLKSAFQELATATINADFTKWIVTAGTDITKFVTSLGGAVPILTTIIGLLAQAKSMKIADGISKTFDGLKQAFKPLKSADSILGTIISRLGLVMTTITAIVAIIGTISRASNGFNKLNDKKSSYANAAEDVKNIESRLETVDSQISSIKSKGELTFVEKSQLADLQKTSAELREQLRLKGILAETEGRGRDSAFAALYGQFYRSDGSLWSQLEGGASVLGRDMASGKLGGFLKEIGSLLGSESWGSFDSDEFEQYLKEANENYTQIGEARRTAYESLVRDGKEYAAMSGQLNDTSELAVSSAQSLQKAFEIYNKYKDASEGIERNEVTEPVFQIIDYMESRLAGFIDYSNSLDESLRQPFYNILESGMFDDVKNKLTELAEAGVLTNESFKKVDGIEEFLKVISSFGVTGEQALRYTQDKYTPEKIAAVSDTQSNILNQTMPSEAVSEIQKSLFEATTGYEKLTKAMAEQEKSGSLSYETWNALIEAMPEANKWLDLTANGFKLNTQAVNDYISAQHEDVQSNITKEIMKRQIAIEELRKARVDLNDEELIAISQAKEEEWTNQINQFKALSMEIYSATDALSKYRAASKTANQDAEHTEGQGILKSVQEAWKSGKVGTDDFKFGMDYLLGEGWETKFEGDLSKAYQAADKVGQKYFGKDDKTNAENFAKELANKGFATYDSKTGELEMLHGSLTEIADAFGISEAAAESLFGLINSFSFGKQITFDKEITSSEEYAAALEAVEKATEERKAAEEELNRVQKETPEDVEAIEAAAQNYNELSAKEEEAKKNAELLNQTLEEGGEVDYQQLTLQDAIDKLTELQGLVNWMNENGITIPAKIKDETGKLESWIGFLNGIEAKGDEGYPVKINADSSNLETELEGAKEQLDDFDKQSPAEAELDGNKDGLDGVIGEANSDISSLVNGDDNNGNLITFDATDNGSINKVDSAADAVTEKPRTINYTANVEGLPDTVSPHDLTEEQTKAYQERVGNSTAIPMVLSNDPIFDQVTDGDSLKVTVEELPDEYKNEIESEAQKAVDKKDASWFGRGGFVDLNKRPIVPAHKTLKAGYDVNAGDISTILGTHGRIGENGEIGVVLTPILPNGEVLKPGQVDEIFNNLYFEDGEVKLSENISEDLQNIDLKDVLVSALDLSNIPSNYWDAYMQAYAEELHKVHEKIFAEPISKEDTPDFSNILGNDKGSNDDETEEIEIKFFTNDDADVEQVIEDAQKVADANPIELSVSDMVNAQLAQLDLVTQAIGTGVGDTNEGIESIQSLVSAYDELEVAQQKIENAKLSGNEEEINSASSELVSASQNFMSAYKTLSAKVNAIQTVKVTADVQQALDKINKLSETTVTVNVDANTGNTNTGAKSFTFLATGTRHAKGGLSLVDDGNGVELIEHVKDGTFELGTDNGPRLTNLDKGDVVHTAEETKKILSRTGGIGGFFRDGLNRTKSVIGPAFASGGILGKITTGIASFANTISNGIKKVNSGIQAIGNADIKTGGKSEAKKSTKNNSSSNSNDNNTNDSTKAFDEYVKKLFDWIEIRLEKLKEKTDSWVKKAEDAIKLSSKQSYTEKAIKAVDAEISANKKGAKRYQKQANEIAKQGNLSSSIIKKIKSGTIDIASYDEDMQKVIGEYQKWYEKAQDCKKAVKELTDQEKELAKQKLDNIADYYDNKISAAETTAKKNEATRDYLVASGKNRPEGEGKNYTASLKATYTNEIKKNDTKYSNLDKEQKKLKSERKSLMKRGLIKKGDATWNEYEQRINDIDIEKIETLTDNRKLRDEKKRIAITQLGYKRDKLDNKAEARTQKKDIAEARGTLGTQGQKTYYQDMIDLMKQSNKLYDEENTKLKELQNGLDPMSEKYQELEKEIQANAKAQRDNTLAMEEYKDSIRDVDYSNLEYSLELAKAASDKISDKIDIKSAKGKLITEEDYAKAITSNASERQILNDRKASVETNMADMLKGKTKKQIKEIKSSKEYRELEKEGLSIEDELRQNTLTNLSLKKQKNNVKAELIGKKLINNEARGEQLRGEMDLATATGTVSLRKIATGEGPGGYNDQIKNLKDDNKFLKSQTEEYLNLQKGMEKYSDEWQELQDKIDANTSSIQKNNIAIQESQDAMDNAYIERYNNKIDKVEDNITKANDNIEMKNLTGKEVVESDYEKQISYSKEELDFLQKQRDKYAELKDTVAIGSKKYFEYTSALRDVDAQIRNVDKSIVQFQKDQNNLRLQNAQWVGDELNRDAESIENDISLTEAKGGFVSANDYNKLIQNGKARIDNLLEQNALLEEQQKGMDVNSEEYQRLQDKMAQNSSTIKDIEKNTEEWKNQIEQIPLDKLAHDFDQVEAKSNEIQDNMNLDQILGKEITANAYQGLIDSGNKEIAILNERKATLKDIMLQLIAQNGESAKQSKEYRDIENELNGIDSQVRGITQSQANWNKEIENLDIQKLVWAFDKISADASAMSDAMSLHEAQGIDETAKTYNELIQNGFEQISILEKENEEYRQQQVGMDILSDAYQDIQKKIEANNRSINQMKVSQEGWNDAVVDLDIDKLTKYKDALSKQNNEYKKQKELQEAIQDLEKAGTQRTLRVYREGVGFAYESDQDEVKQAQEKLQDVVQNQLLDKVDDLIEALKTSKEDTNVYDANGNLLGQQYNTPQLGTLADILSSYSAKNAALVDFSALKDTLGESFTLQGVGATNNKSLALEIGGITVNEVNNGNEFAKAIVDQFPNALLQALYAK